MKSFLLFPLGTLALACIYASLVMGELLGSTSAFLYLRNGVGVPITLLRITVFALTILPVAYLAGIGMIRWSPRFGHVALFSVAVAFAIVIGLLQIFLYDMSVWSSSLLKVLFACGGLLIATGRSRAR